jgi:hypothetical protein
MNSSKPETEPARDEVAKKAYSLYLEEGRPKDTMSGIGWRPKLK